MILDQVNSPRDLKKLTFSELEVLARELRETIIATVSRTGGHLAPSLGVVELALAVHCVFNSPTDKLIWDVGHQSYVHKLVTGRREQFTTLRQHNGLSGFPKSRENENDVFNTGHSSTSISAALGLALARDQRGEDHSVLAIIGDGALSGGMAFEALNHAGHLKTDLIVILNDNKMSISNNVGALSSYLGKLRTDPMYYKGKEEMEAFLRSLPAIGSRVVRLAEKFKDSIKYLVVPGIFFEELGFTYLGPVDGHNINKVKAMLWHAKNTRGPVLVHVITVKGKGFGPAEKNPNKFHGIGAFDPQTGKLRKENKLPSYTKVFSDTLVKIGERDPKVMAVTAAMPEGTGLEAFRNHFPGRFFDVGIAEQHAVTFSAGLAAGGYKPIVAIYSTFLQRGYDQILHDVCLQNLPVVFALDRSGIVGEDGETHQGLFDFAYLRNIPGMVISAPKDEDELQHMLFTAIDYGQPIAVRYPRGEGIGVPMAAELQKLPIGKGEVLREGQDLLFLGVGPVVYRAWRAADRLAKFGLEAAVINARFVKPLDRDLIVKYASRVSRIVTLEEHVLAGGFGSAVLELLADEGLKGYEVLRLGIPDTFVDHGNPEILRAKYGLTEEAIISTIRRRFGLVPRPRVKGQVGDWVSIHT